MYTVRTGRNTSSEIASWRIFRCGSVRAVYPIRLAGTWNWYSKNATLHAAIAARYHGFAGQVSQVTVPCVGHERVGDDQQQRRLRTAGMEWHLRSMGWLETDRQVCAYA